MEKLRLGIIGYGGMGSWHAENIRNRIDCIEVAGAYDVKLERLSACEKDGFTPYNSAEKLLDDIDICLIATPNNFHKYYSIMVLSRKIAVVCEKPVCMNSGELEEIIAAANANKTLFTVHHNRRWDIDFAVVKEVMERGLIGKPYFIDSRLFGSKGLPGDWRSAPEGGGGMLYDWSVHLIDQMLQLVGSEVESVYCQALKVTFKSVDDCNKILLRFKNGVRAQIVVDTWCYVGENRWHISADDGTLVINDWLQATGKAIKANREIDWEEGIILTPTGRTRTMASIPRDKLEEIPLPTPEQPRWEEFYENVADFVRGKAAPIVTHEQLIASMKVLDACFLSEERDEVIKL